AAARQAICTVQVLINSFVTLFQYVHERPPHSPVPIFPENIQTLAAIGREPKAYLQSDIAGQVQNLSMAQITNVVGILKWRESLKRKTGEIGLRVIRKLITTRVDAHHLS